MNDAKVESDGSSAKRQAILLVDDEEDILESLTDLLEACIDGVDVYSAPSGPEALRVLAEQPVDLIISDYKMPGMNGLEFLGRARGVAPSVPRVLATAFPDLDIAVRAINETNVENFITKPFDPEKVIDIVKGILAKHKAQTQRDTSFARSMEMFRKASGES